MFTWNKKAEIVENKDYNIFEKVETPETDEWIWVEGYKGTNSKMQGKNNFQYELGQEYSTDESVKLYHSGFHLCLKFEDVFNHYPWVGSETNRYFKVKALVKKEDVDDYGQYDKIVAKKIFFTEEITGSPEMIEALKKTGLRINNQTEYKLMVEHGYKNMRKEVLTASLCGKYSDTFIRILLDGEINKKTEKRVEYALAYADEGVSKDVAVYLLMTK